VRKPDREWVRVLLLLEEHSIEALESAVRQALERASPSLETIRMLLRQHTNETLAIAPAHVADARIAAIDVAPANLAGYDQLVGGAA